MTRVGPSRAPGPRAAVTPHHLHVSSEAASPPSPPEPPSLTIVRTDEKGMYCPLMRHISVGCALLDMGRTLLLEKLGFEVAASKWLRSDFSDIPRAPFGNEASKSGTWSNTKNYEAKMHFVSKWWELRLLAIPLAPTSQQYSISLRRPPP